MTNSVCSSSSSQETSCGLAPPVAPGPQVLGVALGGPGDDLVGGVEDGLGAAVVLLQGDDAGVGELLGEVEDVAHRGGPERVDGLGVVAHDGEVLAAGAEHLQDLGLEPVGVLVLVDQDAVEAAADGAGRAGVGQQAVPEEQQVVIVEHALLALVVDVGGEEAAEVFDLVLAPGEVGLDRLVHRLAGVDAAAVDVHAGALEREAAVVLGEAQLGAEHAHEVFGVAAVEDGEGRVEADGPPVQAQQAGGRGVEGAAPDLAGGRGRARGPGRGTSRRAEGSRSLCARSPPGCGLSVARPPADRRGVSASSRRRMPSTRRSISAAARRVKVSSRIRPGSVPVAIR